MLFASSGFVGVRASPSPGVSITVTDIDGVMAGLDYKATFKVITESITDELEHVKLTVTGLPSGWTYVLSPSEFDLDAGAFQESSLEITGSIDTSPGSYSFTVEGEAWPPDFPELTETSSYTSYVYVTLTLVIPEFPIGPLGALLSALAALKIRGISGVLRKRTR